MTIKKKAKIIKAIIPVAGLGTRFLPATKSSPKEMMPIVDKPVIHYIVDEAIASGIEDIILITGRGKRAIEDYFDVSFELERSLADNSKVDLLESIQEVSEMARFCYVRQNRPLGLGHAVQCGRTLVENNPFALLLGDDIIVSDRPFLARMMEMFELYHTPVIGIMKVGWDEVSSYGIVDGKFMDDGRFQISRLIEKPHRNEAPTNLAVIGRYILTPDIFSKLDGLTPGKGGEIQLTDALNLLAGEKPLIGCVVEGVRHDAGDKLGFLKANVEFGIRHNDVGKEFKNYIIGLAKRIE